MVTLVRVIAGIVALAFSGLCSAQSWPARPVRVLVPFAPGGPTDVMARILAQKLSEGLGQQFVVENRAGAGGNIGMGEDGCNGRSRRDTLVATSASQTEGRGRQFAGASSAAQHTPGNFRSTI